MVPDDKILMENLGKIAYTIDKTYLSLLETDYGIIPFNEYNKDERIRYESNIRALEVKRWVYDKEESIADCFKNVLGLFVKTDNNLALVINRTSNNTKMYFVLRNEGPGRNEESMNNIKLLESSLRGNFNGTDIKLVHPQETKKLFQFEKEKSISILSNIPSEKSEDYICQGIEKLLNGIVPRNDDESYTVVILAEPLSPITIRGILSGYEDMATAITPFAGYQFQKGKSETTTDGEMSSLSHSEGVSNAISKTHSVNVSADAIKKIGETLLTAIGTAVGGPVGGTAAKIVSKFIGDSFGVSGEYGYSRAETETKSVNDTKTTGTNHSVSLGDSETTSYTYKSYMIAGLISKLEAIIKRINESQATCLWRYASYVLTNNPKTSKNVNNFLCSISQGDNSYIEPSFIQEWQWEKSHQPTVFDQLKEYIKNFSHPIFVNKIDKISVTPTANVSTTELADVMAFPRYSVQGLPVIECAIFGREPHSIKVLDNALEGQDDPYKKEDEKIKLKIGCAYHMHQKTENKHIMLDKDKLTSHTFITGSTGSGKSNTVYKLLEEVKKTKGLKFLVIEPAKGEYKDIFCSNVTDVKIYGTNPNLSPLLEIDPFSFNDGIHILEHIDRLIDIFNVCWSMYDAMPAVLKDAIEKSYEEAGWDLCKSKNKYNFKRYPCFVDVIHNIKEVMESSDYSDEVKGNYKGALVTRLKSLTNGINGMIFVRDKKPPEELFDENVIIDLSRIGSMETKALIMGFLVMKLHEYRMTESKGKNLPLKHITVLEEAHHLLKRTSTEQSSQSSNLIGKSVEMLTNSIAEMRTYGEGFIIADQAPGLLDISVIRNTNTKIILRLPDETDRVLVGKSANLNDDQIKELARLPMGVAAVYQNDWIQPVLCQVDRAEGLDNRPYSYKPDEIINNINTNDTNALRDRIMRFLLSRKFNEKIDENIDKLKERIIKSNLENRVVKRLIDYLNANPRSPEKLGEISEIISSIYSFSGDIFKKAKKMDIKEFTDDWENQFMNDITPKINHFEKDIQRNIMTSLFHETMLRNNDIKIHELCSESWKNYINK